MALIDNKLFSYFKQSKDELRKVTWPTRKETTRSTLVVVAMSLGVALFLGIVDYFLNIGLEQLLANR